MGFFSKAKQKIESGVKTVQATHHKIQAAKEQRQENELNRVNQKIATGKSNPNSSALCIKY